METMVVTVDGRTEERLIDYYEENEKRRGLMEPVPYLKEGETYYRTIGGGTVIVKT